MASKLGLIESNISKYDQTLYYLVGVMPDGTLSYVDGSHDTPQGVATAQELYQSIGIYKDKQPVRWVMVTASPVPQITAKAKKRINRKAIATLNNNLGVSDGK